MKKTRWALLIVIGIFALDRYIQLPDGRARALNRALEAKASPSLRAYPYQFHVVETRGEVALVSTPRNFEVPAFHAIGVMYPQLDVKDANNPAFIAAEQTLGAVQAEARAIVLAEPGVKGVEWVLDRDWLRAHYIEIPDK